MERAINLKKANKIGVSNGINYISLENPHYPRLLKQIYKAPPLLYYRGSLPNCGVYISIVGSRKPNSYGKKAVEKIISELSGQDVCIVSGLARGIDAHAHICALEANIKTIAVLGTGVDDMSIYPKENIPLAHKIIYHESAIISQFPPGSKASKRAFPQRNFVISGLSHSVVIIQAAEKSGALITARAALEQNRNVYAVPGNIFDPLSFGPNLLIKEGATPLLNGVDLLS